HGAARGRRSEGAQGPESRLPRVVPRGPGRAGLVRRLGARPRLDAAHALRSTRRGPGVSATATGTDLRVRIGALTLAGPVLAASGTYGYGDEFGTRFALERLGGIVTKTVTLKP